MFRQDQEQKRRLLNSQKRHFGGAHLKPADYPHRLNFYTTPPTAEITLDQFEQWAINRLRVLGEIENSLSRNKTPDELKTTLQGLLKKDLHLESNSTNSSQLHEQRQKDHYSHFILRLAFARSEDLRRRFSKAETILFKHRFETDDASERAAFIASLGLDWEPVSAEERDVLSKPLLAASGQKKIEDGYYKVDWERVTDLVERRQVFLKAGKAYVPSSLHISLVVAEFTNHLDKALELTARALPRLDEDDRLIPILNHLSLGFAAPEYAYSTDSPLLSGDPITAASIDGLAVHFPACMLHLHRTLRQNKHLKHYGRFQYTLFLKGIGLSIDEALTFWRTAFSTTPEDKFNKEYRYNVRHSYGLEGGGRKYRPRSCQQILLENPPGAGDSHGCPYRHFSADNLNAFLQGQMDVKDRNVLKGVQQDVEVKKYHMACNRVFEHTHSEEIRREKERLTSAGSVGVWGETLIHPNDFFIKSWELAHPETAGMMVRGEGGSQGGGRMEVEIRDEPMM